MKKKYIKFIYISVLILIILLIGNIKSEATEESNMTNLTDICVTEDKVYINGEIAKNKKYIVTKGEDINSISDIEFDEENSLMEIEDYIPYKLTTTKENDLYIWQAIEWKDIYTQDKGIEDQYNYYIWQTNEEGKLEKLGNTTEYTGFYNGRAYRNGKILTDTMISLDKGTSIKTDANINSSYEVVEDLTVEEFQTEKDIKDIYMVNAQGQLSENIIKENTSRLVGDINLDGTVDLLDVIYLNKYLARLVILTDYQLQAADCYLDGNVNEEDAIALTKYVILLIDELPERPEDQSGKKEFTQKENNEFYEENIIKEIEDLDLIKIAKIIKNKINTQEDIGYTEQDLEIKELYKDGRFINGINGSSYVGMCLYQYGIYTQNEDVINYVTKDDGKLTQARLYGITNEELEDLGWQKLEYTSKDNLIKGDIIVTYKDIQIYTEYGAYECNNEEDLKNTQLATVIEPENGKYIIRIEPTEGKCGDEINWKIEDKTLTISGEGEMYNYTNRKVPWSASNKKLKNASVNILEATEETMVVAATDIANEESEITIEIHNASSYILTDLVKMIKIRAMVEQKSIELTTWYWKTDTIIIKYSAKVNSEISICDNYDTRSSVEINVIRNVNDFRKMWEGYGYIPDHAETFLKIQETYGVNAVFAASVAWLESHGGKSSVLVGEEANHETYNWMSLSWWKETIARRRYHYDNGVNDTWCEYDNFDQAIVDFGRYISMRYHTKYELWDGKTRNTVDEIAGKYSSTYWGDAVNDIMTSALKRYQENKVN